MDLYEYATIRLVPDVEREEFINIGLIMLCKRRRWIKIQTEEPSEIAHCFCPWIDPEKITDYLKSFKGIASGSKNYGPFALMEPEERFRWLTAVKSAILQTSRPHPGITESLHETFDHIYRRVVSRQDTSIPALK